MYAEGGLQTERCHDFMLDSRFWQVYDAGKRAMGPAYHAILQAEPGECGEAESAVARV